MVYLKTHKGLTHVYFVNLSDKAIAHFDQPFFRTEKELIGFYTLLHRGEPPRLDNQVPEQVALLEFRDMLRKAWQGDTDALEVIKLLAQGTASWTLTERGEIELTVENLWGAICMLFLRDYGRLAVCSNPKCHNFFVRNRRTQKFCSRNACKVYSHQVSANDYWQARKRGQ